MSNRLTSNPLIDAAGGALRTAQRLIGGAEHEVTALAPPEVEHRVHEAVAALHRNADSLDRHVAAVEGLLDALPALTGAITELSQQLTAAMTLLAPVEAVEREVSGIGRLFGRRRRQVETAAAPAGAPAQSPEGH